MCSPPVTYYYSNLRFSGQCPSCSTEHQDMGLCHMGLLLSFYMLCFMISKTAYCKLLQFQFLLFRYIAQKNSAELI